MHHDRANALVPDRLKRHGGKVSKLQGHYARATTLQNTCRHVEKLVLDKKFTYYCGEIY